VSSAADSAPTWTDDKALRASIRALQEEREERSAAYAERMRRSKVRKTVDLNGIKPQNLIFGAATYGVVAYLGWQFTDNLSEIFDEGAIAAETVYMVARLKYGLRYLLVLTGALGSSIASIAAVGQLALSVQVAIGIMKGDLDPNAKRVDPYGDRKQTQLQKYLSQMLGQKDL
jgi:hypothetical protein